MDIISAKQFTQRSQLESYVRNKYNLTSVRKTDVEISGTKSELARIGLSGKTIFWGISCSIVPEPGAGQEETTATEPVDRGALKPFGINGSTTKPPRA